MDINNDYKRMNKNGLEGEVNENKKELERITRNIKRRIEKKKKII
jgi:hypothetical protein